MEINCLFPPSLSTPDHVVLAETLAYLKAWVYDVPVSFADTGGTLGLAATRTSGLALGVSVFAPYLRHSTVNAGLIAYLATIAPGRFDVGVGIARPSQTSSPRGSWRPVTTRNTRSSSSSRRPRDARRELAEARVDDLGVPEAGPLRRDQSAARRATDGQRPG